MKKGFIIAVTIVAVIAVGNVLLASAQGNTPPWQPNGPCPLGYTCPYSGTSPYGGMMGGRGMMGGWQNGTYSGTLPYSGMSGMHNFMMGTNGMHQQVWTAVAQKLGMTYEQLTQATQNGQTIAQLAQARGVSLDELKNAALAATRTYFADLVKQGLMTQAQADAMVDHMDDMPMFNFGSGYGPGFMGPGMMRGWQNGAPSNGSFYGPGMMGRGGMMRGWQQPTGPQG